MIKLIEIIFDHFHIITYFIGLYIGYLWGKGKL